MCRYKATTTCINQSSLYLPVRSAFLCKSGGLDQMASTRRNLVWQWLLKISNIQSSWHHTVQCLLFVFRIKPAGIEGIRIIKVLRHAACQYWRHLYQSQKNHTSLIFYAAIIEIFPTVILVPAGILYPLSVMPLGPAFLTVAGTGPYNLSASLNTYSHIQF